MKGLTRRSLVLGAGGALAATFTTRRPRAAEPADVIIIGAGLAGLYGAYLLTEAGARVTVLEASRRPGGRVYTADDLPGRPEWGAAQVGAYYARLRDLAPRIGVGLEPWVDNTAPMAYAIGGQLVAREAWASSPLNRTVGAERALPPPFLLEALLGPRRLLGSTDAWLQPAAAPLDQAPAAWLAAHGVSPEAIRLIGEGIVPTDLRTTSLLTMLQESTRQGLDAQAAREIAARGDDPVRATARITGGTSRLPEALVRSLGDRVRFGQVAAAIRQDARGVEVITLEGRRHRGDFALAAIPFSVLRRVALDPPPPALQAEAIQAMPYGNTTLVLMAVRGRPYWEQDGLAPSLWSDGPVNIYRQFTAGGDPYLMALSTGFKGERLDQLDPEARGRFVMADLARLRPATRGKLKVLGVHSWQRAPFIEGCRHSYAPGQILRFAPTLAEPHGRLHFAGEHTRRLEIGMEAALESGERAVMGVLAG